jgi:hypothetical protein
MTRTVLRVDVTKIQRSVLTANPALLYTYTSPDYSNTENRKEWCW